MGIVFRAKGSATSWRTLDGMRMPSFLLAMGAALAILAGAITLPAGASPHRGPRSSDVVYFRSVLCYAPAYDSAASDPGSLSASSCSLASRLNESNLGVTPKPDSAGGFTVLDVAPDAALAGVPSTSAARETAAATVLLPASSKRVLAGVARYLMGPAEMTSASVAAASAQRIQTGAWVVNFAVTTQGAVLWDKVAEDDFHEVLGIDFQGEVVSVPIIEPTQSSFTSLNGLGEISGNLTKAEALALARALRNG